MQRFAIILVGVAATLFLMVSAVMNCLFLSSLGRNEIEAYLFGAISIAADIAKAVLPVLVARAVALRLWDRVVLAGIMLMAVMGLSLASGMGFAAMTREDVVARRATRSGERETLLSDLAALEPRLSALSAAREAAVIEADLAALTINRRYAASKGCTVIEGAAAREFCGEALRLRGELAASQERQKLAADRERLRGQLVALPATASQGSVDPQSSSLAGLLGLPERVIRGSLTFGLAVVLELGSVVLVLIASAPFVARKPKRRAKPKAREQTLRAIPAELPVQPDRQKWHRDRAKRLTNGLNGKAARTGDGHGA